MADLPKSRRAYRRTDDHTPGTPKIELVTEDLPLPLGPTQVLLKVHAVALNYRDANISHGGNPWPIIPHGVIGNDAGAEVIACGDQVRKLKVGDRAAPNTDTENITGRENKRSWPVADEDGVLADYLVFDERSLGKLPDYLDWVQASIIPCAGVTAWSALKGAEIGQSVLIQGTMTIDFAQMRCIQSLTLNLLRYWWCSYVCTQACTSTGPEGHLKLIE